MNTSARYVYHPVKSYQTRLVFLHGDGGDPGSHLICEIRIADILHDAFEGFGVRGKNGEDDAKFEYEALSYTWGDGIKTNQIECEGAILPITSNLFQALRALRPSGNGMRTLWVDSICIDQKNDSEKASQILNMLGIFQKAKVVVAWLGETDGHLEAALTASAFLDLKPTTSAKVASGSKVFVDSATSQVTSQNPLDVQSVCAGLRGLYSNPWFRRIWVQQEIYAARQLRFIHGHGQFDWNPLFSRPALLLKLPDLERYEDILQNSRERTSKFSNLMKKERSKFEELVPNYVLARRSEIIETKRFHETNLACFEELSKSRSGGWDLVELLLLTGRLNATDPRDYIYGVIDMSKFPAKPMLIKDWIMLRNERTFIPIDYTADLRSIMICNTWAVLMEGGLDLLMIFKAFSDCDNNGTSTRLPSWVIDWRLAAKLFELDLTHDQQIRQSRTMETFSKDYELRYSHILGITSYRLIEAYGRVPREHAIFQSDNHGQRLSYQKLAVRGRVMEGFEIRSRCIVKRVSTFPRETLIWSLDFYVEPSDIIATLDAYKVEFELYRDHAEKLEGPIRFGTAIPDLWLLRPAQNEGEFHLMAGLRVSTSGIVGPGIISQRCFDMYSHFRPVEKYPQTQSQRSKNPSIRRLRVHPDGEGTYGPPKRSTKSSSRTFILI